MSRRESRPLQVLLKMKTLDPSLEFMGADKATYEEFIEQQAEMSLLETLKAEPAPAPKKKKASKKVKQTLPKEMIVSGEMEATDGEVEFTESV